MPNRATAQTSGETTLLYIIKQVELAIRARLEEMLRPAGLTALQYTALTVLERHPNLTSAQLARNSFVTAQTMADMVTGLQANGLVQRRRDPTDRRRLILELSTSGRRVLRRFRPKVRALEEEMLAGLTRAQAGGLRSGLIACRSALADRAPQ